MQRKAEREWKTRNVRGRQTDAERGFGHDVSSESKTQNSELRTGNSSDAETS